MFGKAIRSILLILFFSGSLLPIPAFSTHIVGGELNYRYLGNNVYQVSLTVYRDCYNGVPPFDNPASVGIFDALTNNFIREKLFNFIDLDTVPPTINAPCFVPPTDICYERTVYTDTIILPPSSGGYILSYQRCCRNITILNIITPNSVGATYEAWLAGTSTFSQNSNPVFNLWPPPFICAGVPFIFDHSASDFEGDSIVYELITPLNGGTIPVPMPQPPQPPPYQQVVFQPPYSQADMLGGNPPLAIDANTGQLTCFPVTVGQFVIGVRAKEFRGGILVGYTRRDLQLNVVPCPTLVVAALQNPLISCGSNTVVFQNFSFNAGAYHWDFGVPALSDDTSALTSPSYTYPDTGTYTVTLVAYSNVDPTCTDTTTGTVTILPDYVPSFVFALDTCSNTVSFNDTSNTVSGTTSSHQWQFGDGSGSSQADPVHQYQSPGSYTVQLIATSSRGCIDTLRQIINIPPLLGLNVQQPVPVSCFGDCDGTAAVQAIHGLPPYSYQWNDPLNQITPAADSLCAGNYSVTVTDARGCSSTANIQINSPAPLTVSVSTLPDYCGGICAGQAIALPSGGNGSYSYQWSDPQNQTTSAATGLCPGTFTVTVTDARGCEILAQLQVVYVDSFPSLEVTADTTVLYEGQSTGLHALVPSAGYTFTWSPPDGLNHTDVQHPVATPAISTTYTVIATDENGCSVRDSITIVIRDVLCLEPEIFIPSAFSPNGDQQNDILFVRGNTIDKVYMAIYDRWGEKVFETRSRQIGWNGTYKGQAVPPDVYVYYVEITCYNQAEFRKKGNITVIR
ncbi:MAG: gliding motility-associated C-terminal domain-containing protein [Bacteroidia bacterium]|nr:gliding motility-associated C-terminal domain-containing protein [Bacteroidia bacterium]